jgi:hypothetical protein
VASGSSSSKLHGWLRRGLELAPLAAAPSWQGLSLAGEEALGISVNKAIFRSSAVPVVVHIAGRPFLAFSLELPRRKKKKKASGAGSFNKCVCLCDPLGPGALGNLNPAASSSQATMAVDGWWSREPYFFGKKFLLHILAIPSDGVLAGAIHGLRGQPKQPPDGGLYWSLPLELGAVHLPSGSSPGESWRPAASLPRRKGDPPPPPPSSYVSDLGFCLEAAGVRRRRTSRA